MEAYDPRRQVAENLYCVDSDWENTPFRRRMTVIVLKSGELVIHSAVRMKDADMAALDKLGRVVAVVAPNMYHGSEAQWYADRYPAAKVLVPYDAGGALRKHVRIDGTLEDDWPAVFDGELGCQPVLGARMCEAVFLHRPSRTLIVTDLVFNLPESAFKPGLLKTLMKWNGVVGRFGPSKLFQHYFANDKYKLRSTLEKIYEWDFDRVIMSHGQIVESGGKEKLRESFRPIFDGLPDRRRERRDEDDSPSAPVAKS